MTLVSLQSLDERAVISVAPDVEFIRASDTEEFQRLAITAEIVVGVHPEFLPTLIRSSTALRWAHTSTAGADSYICDELKSSDVILTCAKGGAAGRNLAEHALGLALALSRNIAESARSSSWRRGELSAGAFELTGKKTGIAGFGAAGRDIADLLSGFRMDINAVKRNAPFGVINGVQVLPASRFIEMLEDRDVIFNFLPASPATLGIFDRRAFAAMKREALFINVGRGSTVETSALVDALKSGAIAGAGIDTVEPEPLPEDHPLWSMNNVVISPHIAGVSPARKERNERDFLENLGRYIRGEALRNVVDPIAGY